MYQDMIRWLANPGSIMMHYVCIGHVRKKTNAKRFTLVLQSTLSAPVYADVSMADSTVRPDQTDRRCILDITATPDGWTVKKECRIETGRTDMASQSN